MGDSEIKAFCDVEKNKEASVCQCQVMYKKMERTLANANARKQACIEYANAVSGAIQKNIDDNIIKYTDANDRHVKCTNEVNRWYKYGPGADPGAFLQKGRLHNICGCK